MMDTDRGEPAEPCPRFPAWEAEFRAAGLETDEEVLRKRISDAQGAAFKRLQEIQQSGEHAVERTAIDDAVRALRIMGGEALGYPRWEGASWSVV
jgi:hypothetical protein